jgi:hypothetical protein
LGSGHEVINSGGIAGSIEPLSGDGIPLFWKLPEGE